MLNSEKSLFLTSPFYIDRKYRPHLTPQPRCICFKLNVKTQINSLETSINSITNFHKKSCKYYMRSQQLSPRIKVDSPKARMQQDKKNTLIFKQKLKKLLEQYYQIRQLQFEHLNEKIKNEKQKQAQKIQKSIKKLLNQKKIAYLYIKQEQINNKNQIDYNKLKVQQNNHQKIENIKAHKTKKIKLIEYFTKQFIEKQSIGDQKKVSKQNIEKGILKFLQHKTYMMSNLHKTYPYGQFTKFDQDNKIKNKTISSFKLAKQEQEQSTSKIQDFNKLKNYNGMNTLQNIIKNDNALEQITRNLNQITQKSFQNYSKSGQGTQKFYKVIKQLLVKSKQEKAKQEFSTKTSSRNDIQIKSFQRNKNNANAIKKYENQKNQSKQYLKNIQNVTNLALEQIKQKQKLKIKIIKKQNKIGKLKQPKLNSKQSLNNINKKQPNKTSIKKIFNKKQKIDKVSSSRLKQFVNEQIVQEKYSKSKNNTQKVGLNYAKLYGKILKVAQSSKKIISPQKLKYLKKMNTRQAYLKRKNRFRFEDVQRSIENSLIQNSQQKDTQIQNVQSSNQNDSSSSSLYNLYESKLRLTKYEETRLIYNMRNIKSREMIQTMKNTAQQKDILKIQMPRLCKLNELEYLQQNERKKQGSIVRNADNYEQQVVNQNQDVMENKNLNCQKNMLTYSQIQLGDLRNVQQFDLGEVKKNIVLYLKKFMKNNQKARQLYNFLIFIEKSRKITIQQQEINSSFNQLQAQKQQIQIKNIVSMLDLKIHHYQTCNIIQKSSNLNQKDLLTNKSFIDKLDSRSIEIMYYNNQQNLKFMETLCQRSLQQLKNLPL